MKRINKYLHLVSIGIQEAIEYKAAFFVFVLSAFFPIIVKYYLWTAIYKNSSTVFGYSYTEMISYTVISSLVSKITITGFKGDVNDDIKNGGLNKYLVRPIDYSLYRICNYIGNKIIQFLIVIVVPFSILIPFNIYDLQIEYGNIVLFLIALILALTQNFYMFYALSLSTFWLKEAWGVFILADIIINFLSGGLFPLEAFGDTFVNISKYFPFQYTIYFPSNVLSGKLDLEDIVYGMAIQIFWTILFVLISRMVWRAGTKIYTANGG
jgi:ABC-2 type transport system permease protein